MTEKEKNNLISRIIELQYEEIKLIFNGHKPHINDFFQSKRDELIMLRCIVYGYDSKFCKLKKDSNNTFV